MNQNDFCQACGGQKILFVTTIDGYTNPLPPGSSMYMPKDIVDRWELACENCGLLYSLNSLMNPIELYE